MHQIQEEMTAYVLGVQPHGLGTADDSSIKFSIPSGARYLAVIRAAVAEWGAKCGLPDGESRSLLKKVSAPPLPSGRGSVT